MPLQYARQNLPTLAFMLAFGAAMALVFRAEILAAYDQMNPVNVDWTPTSVTVDGDDLIVMGNMIKQRCDCEYKPPPRARDAFGKHYQVTSTNKSAAQSWACSEWPQQFGPWRISGAAHVRVTAYQEHKCGGGRTVFSILGEVEALP